TDPTATEEATMMSIPNSGRQGTGTAGPLTTRGLTGPGVSRRQLFQVVGLGAGSLALAACGPLSSGSRGGGSASGPAEIGVKPAEGTSGHKFLVEVGDKVTEQHPEFTYEYTFVNTNVRPQIEQRWRAGNPPDTDYKVFNAQIPSTHAFVENLLDLTPYRDEEIDGGGTWRESFLEAPSQETDLHGKTYGGTTDAHVIALYHNITPFTELRMEPPAPWDQ